VPRRSILFLKMRETLQISHGGANLPNAFVEARALPTPSDGKAQSNGRELTARRFTWSDSDVLWF
jgi:hypothetical protein